MSDGKCAFCQKKFSEFPFTCKFCGKEYCTDHRLPENHKCLGLEKYKEKQIDSLKSKTPARPIEYFYRKEKPPKKKPPLMPYAIIAAGIIIMVAGYFIHFSLYYIGFILVMAGLIKLFMPSYHA